MKQEVDVSTDKQPWPRADGFLDFFFLCGLFLKVIEFVTILLLFGRKVCGISALQPGIKSIPPALEGKVLTTGLPLGYQGSPWADGLYSRVMRIWGLILLYFLLLRMFEVFHSKDKVWIFKKFEARRKYAKKVTFMFKVNVFPSHFPVFAVFYLGIFTFFIRIKQTKILLSSFILLFLAFPLSVLGPWTDCNL